MICISNLNKMQNNSGKMAISNHNMDRSTSPCFHWDPCETHGRTTELFYLYPYNYPHAACCAAFEPRCTSWSYFAMGWAMCVIPPNQQPCIPFQLPCWTANMDVGWSHVFSRTKQMDMGHRDALIIHPLPQLLFCPLLWQAIDIEATMVQVGHVSQSTWFCWKLLKVVTVVCFKFCVFSFVSLPLILSGVLEKVVKVMEKCCGVVFKS